MIAGIIVYFIIISAILLFDGVWVFTRAKAIDKPVFECNFMRYIRPAELLLSMFAITMLELVVQAYELVTSGFVAFTTLFLGVFAIVYIIDFAIKEFRLRNYKLIIINTKKSHIKNLAESVKVAYHLEDAYIIPNELEVINSTDGIAKDNKIAKQYLITRAVMASFMLVAMIASVIAVAMAK